MVCDMSFWTVFATKLPSVFVAPRDSNNKLAVGSVNTWVLHRGDWWETRMHNLSKGRYAR